MLDVPAAAIFLRDEGTRNIWKAEFPAFRLAPTPVTRGQYFGASADAGLPVTDVSWLDAIRFCNQLSLEQDLEPVYTIGDDPDAEGVVCKWDAKGYRLPSEAEWEYACRAGSTAAQYGELDEIAWYRENSSERIHEVGGRLPNAWGFHDMLGNVWEWTWDLYDAEVYGPYRVFRGGGAYDPPRACRASCRRKSHPTFHIDDLGFRLARSV
ncbi:SUMF1/EgtB/PvdO family nonheme iron enzyme [Kribbella sancticallisti]|uniref:SUMF1/EgtB/PvdO family nonheme iron enzyme n=1 Tax=Kribbella sancticallisti TaxID=460087 RepID=A0ABP4Q901_9ACTN